MLPGAGKIFLFLKTLLLKLIELFIHTSLVPHTVQVCGHVCKEPCSLPCLCRKQCETSCEHSRCPKRCGEPCDPCKMSCGRSCPHGACTKLCSEPCSMEPCLEPCAKAISCGHPCIGLCGEPCPSKCATCNEAEVTEIFFGPEDEEDAMFVQLVDCGHLFHAESLDKWVEDDKSAAPGAVRLPECPRCKTPIRRTQRYNSVINRHFQTVEKVKQKLRGEEDEMHKHKVINQIKEELKDQLVRKIGHGGPRRQERDVDDLDSDDSDDDSDESFYTKEEVKWMGDLVKTVISPQSTLGLEELRKCKQVLESIYILIALGKEPSKLNQNITNNKFVLSEPKKPMPSSGGLGIPAVSALKLHTKLEEDRKMLVDVSDCVVESSL